MLITNGIIVSWDNPIQVIYDHDIFISDGIITRIFPHSELEQFTVSEDPLDAQGNLILPGNICAHTHFYGAFARGLPLQGPPPRNFLEILNKIWWPLDKSLTPEDIYYFSLYCMMEAIKYGTTTLFDHHSSPNAIDGSLDIISEAAIKSGVRCVLGYEVSDRDGQDKTVKGIGENVRFINKCQQKDSHPLISASFGLHASSTLSDKTLETCRIYSPKDVGFHIHAAESLFDQQDSVSKYEMRVINRLNKHQILGPRSILAHAVHVDDNEINILADSNSWVTHQPRSNMNNGVGVAPVEKLISSGVNLCLGNDGFTNDMWQEWKFAYFLQKSSNSDPSSFPASDLIKIAVTNNSRLVNTYFPSTQTGVIRQGATADLILVDYHPPTKISPANFPWHVLFGFNETMVTATIVNGVLLMKNRDFLFLDQEEISRKCQELSLASWDRVEPNKYT